MKRTKIKPQHDDQWAEINEDLLNEIARRIDVFCDYIRFRSTCKNWYAKLRTAPKNFNYPSLLLPSDPKSDSLHPIFHPDEKSVFHHLSLPEAKDTMFCGSCYGWLIAVGSDGTIRMLNPLKRTQIHLPHIFALSNVINYESTHYGWAYDLRDGSRCSVKHGYMQRMTQKVILSCPPDDENQDFMAVAIVRVNPKATLYYCRHGDKIWTQLSEVSNFYDAIFHEGKIYAVDGKGFIYVFDMKTTSGGLSRRPYCDNKLLTNSWYKHTYLVQSNDGLLLVIKHTGYTENERGGIEELHTSGFDVCKLDEYRNKWLEVKTLNGCVLVLGLNSSVRVSPRTISRSNKGDCIYYSDDYLNFHDDKKGGYNNGMFDFKDKTIHPFFPDSNLICPAPIWLV